MKKFLSVLLILAMALTTVAFAETAAIAPVVEEKELTNEEKLTKMLPVLDAMLRTLGIEGEVPYTAEDPALVWNLLVEIAKNERKTNPLILSDDTLMIVPKSVLLEYASASFFGMTELPEIPGDCRSDEYDRLRRSNRDLPHRADGGGSGAGSGQE